MIRQPQAGPGPMAQYGQMMTIKSLMGQQGLQDLQRRKIEDEMQRDMQVRDLFSKGNVTPDQLMAVDPTRGMAYQKYNLESEKTRAGINKTKAETYKLQVGTFRDMVAQARGDADMPVLKEYAFKTWGPEGAARVPDRFDPQWQESKILDADKMISQLENQKNRDVTVRGQDLSAQTQRRGQDISASTALRGQDMSAATTRRGQDMTNDRERDLTLQGNIAREKALGKTAASAQAALPQVSATADRGIRLVDELLAHPGFSSVVGASLTPGARFIPGTDSSDFQARFDEINGGAFMQAFQSLRGGGQITEKEGEKATAAITRMRTSQSEKEFTRGAREFQDVMRGVKARTEQLAGQYPAKSAAPQSATGGIKFLGFE